VLTRSTAGTLGAAMGYLLLGEQLLGGLLSLSGLSTAAIYLPITVGTVLTLYNHTLIQGFEANASIPLDPAVAFAGTLLWTALFLGLAIGYFNRQDLSL
jgi:hypothetical protein